LSGLSDEERQQLNLPEGTQGAVITGLRPDGAAAAQGLRVGDVITQVDGAQVTDPAAVDARIDKAAQANKKVVLLLVNRQGDEIFVGFKLGTV
jgi:serine protease Do